MDATPPGRPGSSPVPDGIAGPMRRLDSWKQVAAYLNRGIRTVQRWESEEGLPVHRLQHEKLGSVYAYESELDAWWAKRGAALEDGRPPVQESCRSIAVLPFKDLSREQDQAYFCEGVAEEIIHALSRIKGLQVASRTSSFRFKTGSADVRQIGRKLRAGTLLEGSVRKSGSRLRIAVQLTDGATAYHLWSESYDRELTDIFGIQEEIARSVVRTLEVTLTPKDTAALWRPPTADVEAYDFYLRGRSFYYRYGLRDIECAIRLFTEAIARDPGYALAYAGLADCWSYIFLYAERSDAAREQAGWASARAVELGPDSAQTHASRGLALSLGACERDAVDAFEAAIRLDPDLFEARYFYARHCFVRGRFDQAIQLYEEAMRVRPEDYQSPLLVAQIYDDLARAAEARASRLRGIENAEQHLRLSPDDARAMYMTANGMAALGRHEEARMWADRALSMRPDDPMILYNAGCVYSLLGMGEKAIACLQQAVGNGLTQKGWFEHDSNLDPLRQHPAFQELLRQLP